MVVKFPSRIKYSKDNPIEDFYKKCISSFEKKLSVELINVVAFSVNSKDYAKLKSLLTKHTKLNYPYLSFKARKFEVSLYLLNYGPRISKKVKIGTVDINEEELHVNFN